MNNISMDTDISDVFKGSGKKFKSIIAGVILAVILIVLITNSVQFVPAGYKGVLLHWNAVDGVGERDGTFVSIRPPLDEGIHFVVPFQDHIVPVEVRTQKVDTQATGASKDLQDVNTSVALNVHIAPEAVHIVWKQIGGDYNNRIIQPAVEETVKKVTAKFNAEELVTKREFAKAEGEAKAIVLIDDAIKNSPNYLEWLKTQKWNGELPKATGGAIPFIQIPMEGQP